MSGHFPVKWIYNCKLLTWGMTSSWFIFCKLQSVFVKHPIDQSWYPEGLIPPYLDAIFPIWLSLPSQAITDPPSSTTNSNNFTPKRRARTMLAQNIGMQQLSQAVTKLYHLAFDSLWHHYDKFFITNKQTLFTLDIK